MFARGCLFSGVVRAAGGFVACCVHVWVVGVFKALKLPSRALRFIVLFYFALLLVAACKS